MEDIMTGMGLRTVLLVLEIKEKELAAASEVSAVSLSRFLRARRRPSAETREKIAAGLRSLIRADNIL